MELKKKIDAYDETIAIELEANPRTCNEFRVWCWNFYNKYDQGFLFDYLAEQGIVALVHKIEDKNRYKWFWSINDIQYVNYAYRIETNAHLSAIIYAIRMREYILES